MTGGPSKLSDLRPCDACGGPIAPIFYALELSMAFIKPQAANQVLGLMQMFGGPSPASLAVAEAFAPAAPVTVAGEQAPELVSRFVICQGCFLEKPVDLAMLTEQRQVVERQRARAAAVETEARG